MANTLYAKLAIALLGLFAVIGIAFLAVARFSTDMYYQEVTQQLNREIAEHIVAEQPLIRAGAVNQDALKALATEVMIINPSVEVFLLDPNGRILGHALANEAVVRQQVDMSPVQRFLDSSQALPILGDDPRSANKKKIFSAAVISDGGAVQGYLYTILGGAKYDSVSELFRSSYIRRLSVWAIGAILLFAFLAGLMTFAVLTRRLGRLSRAVETFRLGQVDELAEVAAPASGGDEIDRLARSFQEMAGRINQQIEHVERTDRMRRELMTNISHDLRTPLASMRGYIETLLIKHDVLSPEDRLKYLEIADKHGEHLSRLVSALFELAKLESDNVEPQLEPFSLAELVQDVTQSFRLVAAERNIALDAELSPELPFVEADIGLIERVLENLIENAIRYTPDGGTVTLRVHTARDAIEVVVADTGRGISRADLPLIFQRFYQSTDRTETPKEGLGLGLAIVKRILELHGSPIDVESEPGRGTMFSFRLPRAAAVA